MLLILLLVNFNKKETRDAHGRDGFLRCATTRDGASWRQVCDTYPDEGTKGIVETGLFFKFFSLFGKTFCMA